LTSGRTEPTGMRTVLCYGDSNTWGYEAGTEGRLGRWVRWTGVLQRALGDDVYVVEEGLNGRTTMFDEPGREPTRNGLQVLPIALETHAPIDVVVLFLGTNDLFLPQRVDARGAARGTRALVELIQASDAGLDGRPPQVLVVVPPPFSTLRADWALDSPHGPEESIRFTEAYRGALADVACDVLDLRGIAEHTAVDGIHFDPDAHHAIGEAVAERLHSVLP
jgi:lysophospholipase L1-like esterase